MKPVFSSHMVPIRSRLLGYFLSPRVILFVFLVFICLRVLYISADPPKNLSWSLGLFFDDGIYNHNARNQILFGQRELDEWNDYYYSVISYWIKYIVLLVIGIGRIQIRLISVGFSLFSLLFIYLACKESYDKPTGFLAVLFLGINYVYLMYNRLGLQDTQTVAVFTLTFYLWQRGMIALTGKGWRWYFFLAGIMTFVTYTFKNLFIFLLPVPFAALLVFLLVRFSHSEQQKKLLQAFGYFSAGSALAFGVWFTTFYLVYKDEIARIGGYMLDKMMLPSTELQAILLNLYKTPFFRYFSGNPILLVCSLLVPLLLYAVFCSDVRSQLHPSDIFFFMWFWAVFLFLGGLAYRPLRWFLPIIPPMCAFAARSIVVLSRAQHIRFPRKIHWGFFPGALFWILVLLYYWRTPYAQILQARSLEAILRQPFFTSLAGAILLTGIIAGFVRWGAGRTFRLPHQLLLITGLLLIIIALYKDGTLYYQWMQTREYTLPTVGNDLQRYLGANAYIAGLDAPGIAYDTPYKTLYTWDQFVNYKENPFDKYQLTHLFLSNHPSTGEQDLYYRKYPEIMRHATLLQQYSIKDTEFNLFSLVEPQIEALTLTHHGLQPQAPLDVNIQVQNHDFRQSVKGYLNWSLFPVTSPASSIPSAIGREVQVWLPPKKQQTVTVSGMLPSSPGKYRLFASWKPSHEERYEAESMESHVGTVEADIHATGARAIRHDVRQFPEEGFLGYGRYYRDYQPGMYEAVFRLKTTTAPPAGETLVVLEAVADYGRQTLQQRTLQRSDFAQFGQYQTFILPFLLYEYTSKVELRIYSSGKADVWADEIKLIYREGVWNQEFLEVEESWQDTITQ